MQYLLMLAYSNPIVSLAKGDPSYENQEQVHQLVEDCLEELNLPDEFVIPGDHVVLKPNWSLKNTAPALQEKKESITTSSWDHLITHPSVIEATARWVAKQLNGTGSILICDASYGASSFQEVEKYCNLSGIVERCAADFPGVVFRLEDLREPQQRPITHEAVSVHLDQDSELARRHGHSHIQYSLYQAVMEADVFINLPKLKTHYQTGLTCALNNITALLADSSKLPLEPEVFQYSTRSKSPKIPSFLLRFFSWLQRYGQHHPPWSWILPEWRGASSSEAYLLEKDFFWKLVLDLNKSLFFFDATGKRRKTSLRFLNVVDAIIAGEGEGPSEAHPKPCGFLLGGWHPLAIDCVAAELMGFDWKKIHLLAEAFTMKSLSFVDFKPENIWILSENEKEEGPLAELKESFDFLPPENWIGQIEKEQGS